MENSVSDPGEVIAPALEVVESLEAPPAPEEQEGGLEHGEGDFEVWFSQEAGDLGAASLDAAAERGAVARESVEDDDLKDRVDQAVTEHEDAVSEAVGTAIEGALITKDEQERPEALRAERYRERITSPEAIRILDESSAQWNGSAAKLEAIMEHLGEATPEEREQVRQKLERSAGKLLFGADADRRADRFVSSEELEKKIAKNLPNVMDIWKNELENGLTVEKLRLRMRSHFFPSQDASAYAIGVKQEDVDRFLRLQEKFTQGAPETKGERPLGQYDFDMARHRAYYEARRTARNVFTNVTSSERAMRIIEDGAIKSSVRTTSTEASTRELQAAGQTGNIEENVYFTSGGGGYGYGARLEQGQAANRTPDDFMFFATTGGAFMASGKSIEVGSPTMTEQHESLRGRVAGDYESADGAELSLDSMFIVAPESQGKKYRDALIARGRSAKDAYTRVMLIPDDIVAKAMESGSVSRDDPNIQRWVDENLSKKLTLRTKAYKGLYATTRSRASRDAVSENTGKVHEWTRMDAPPTP